jgi:hypothetical protein
MPADTLQLAGSERPAEGSGLNDRCAEVAQDDAHDADHTFAAGLAVCI